MIRHLSLILFIFLFHATPVLSNTKLLHDGYIIKYKDVTASLNSTRCTLNTKECILLNFFNMEVVKDLSKNRNKQIEYIEPNWIYHTMHTPDDAYFHKQWGLKKIQAEKAWDISLDYKDIIVAVIDTGIDYTHSDLKNQMWVNEKELNGEPGVDDDENGYVDDIYGYDFVNKDGDPIDDHSHGTHCAGVIGAEHNSTGIAGINKYIKLMALKFLSKSGSGSAADAILAVKYAVDHGANILSNSWGGGGSSQAMKEAIEYAKSKGVIFVAAAGNESNNNDSKPTYPASYKVDNVISVAASDTSDKKASFSNYGVSVHIAAPGVNIYSTVTNNKFASYSGTSMACPHISGALALLMSHETLTLKEYKARLIDTSDYLENWEDSTVNAGRLNLWNLLKNIKPERPLPPNPDIWISYNVSLETPHPYENNKTYSFDIKIPKKSKFFRIHFKSFNTEAKFDKVRITAGGRTLQYDGNLGVFFTKHLNVENIEKVTVKLITDGSKTSDGFKIDLFQIQ